MQLIILFSCYPRAVFPLMNFLVPQDFHAVKENIQITYYEIHLVIYKSVPLTNLSTPNLTYNPKF